MHDALAIRLENAVNGRAFMSRFADAEADEQAAMKDALLDSLMGDRTEEEKTSAFRTGIAYHIARFVALGEAMDEP